MATQRVDHIATVCPMEPPVSHRQLHQSEPLASPTEFDLARAVPAFVYRPPVSRLPSSNDYMNDLPSPPSTIKTSPSGTSPHNQHGHLISPPISRSASLNGKGAGQVDGWRDFTAKLRQQFLGEKAHMEADRARAEEVMAEERTLWEKERACYEERIAELEAQLAEFTSPVSQRSAASTTAVLSAGSPLKAPAHHSPGNDSDATTAKGNSLGSPPSKAVIQESGRNADGSPFYAPVSRHPSRTFESMPLSELRVDSMSAPHETPFRVTSKELKESDFLRSPTSGEPFSPQESTMVGDSIDISFIEPELEGVPIKSSAVAPTFAAQVRSPSGTTMSPSTFSPDRAPPPRPMQSYDRHPPILGPRRTQEIIKQPEGRRLTMHAGHTPNHSVIHFELGDSGISTPKSSARDSKSVAVVTEQAEPPTEDPELKGPLGLINDAPEDEQFLAALTSKLEEVVAESAKAKSETGDGLEEQSMTNAQVLQSALRAIGRGNGLRKDEDENGEGLVAAASTDDIPMLKFKRTPNFGRPLGSL